MRFKKKKSLWAFVVGFFIHVHVHSFWVHGDNVQERMVS